jgi:hypothetical protein
MENSAGAWFSTKFKEAVPKLKFGGSLDYYLFWIEESYFENPGTFYYH